MFQVLTGTKMNHVPYKGAAPAVADLLPGRIQVWIGAANTLLPHIKEGKLRLLGDTPTIAQSVPATRSTLARPVRAGEDTAGRAGEDPWRGGEDSEQPRPEVEARPAGHRAGNELARGVRALHPRRQREVGQDHQGSRHQGPTEMAQNLLFL
jgi:hypothetical protein